MRQVRDLAEAARLYARLELEAQNDAGEIKLRAERRAGELRAQMPNQGRGEYQRLQRETVAPSYAESVGPGSPEAVQEFLSAP